MKKFIYGLTDPFTNEVVYVGSTTHKLEFRLKQHYWQLNEAKRGGRCMNRRFKYLDSLLPNKVNIILLAEDEEKIGPHVNLETLYIMKYRKINPNLLNETNGNKGGNTLLYSDDKRKQEAYMKVSKGNKGKPKPEGFGEKLSKARKGLGNPACKRFTDLVLALNKDLSIEKYFYYSFEIDEYCNCKGAWSNIKKNALNKLCKDNSPSIFYDKIWITEKNYDSYKDIVRLDLKKSRDVNNKIKFIINK